MFNELRLSQEVQDFINDLDQDDTGLTPAEFAESQNARRVIEFIVDYLIKSRETIIDNQWEILENIIQVQPRLVESLLDERFTKDVVVAVPGYVRRTLQLSRMTCTRIPSKITNGYLREAVHTYIFGLPQASVALSRAALEQALKEEMGYQLRNNFVKMSDLLNEAESAGVVDHANRVFAREVADAADDVLHEKPTTLAKALDILVKLRGILQFVYSEE